MSQPYAHGQQQCCQPPPAHPAWGLPFPPKKACPELSCQESQSQASPRGLPGQGQELWGRSEAGTEAALPEEVLPAHLNGQIPHWPLFFHCRCATRFQRIHFSVGLNLPVVNLI